jgi:hypothetical protein
MVEKNLQKSRGNGGSFCMPNFLENPLNTLGDIVNLLFHAFFCNPKF